jgi:hypothetical protein
LGGGSSFVIAAMRSLLHAPGHHVEIYEGGVRENGGEESYMHEGLEAIGSTIAVGNPLFTIAVSFFHMRRVLPQCPCTSNPPPLPPLMKTKQMERRPHLSRREGHRFNPDRRQDTHASLLLPRAHLWRLRRLRCLQPMVGSSHGTSGSVCQRSHNTGGQKHVFSCPSSTIFQPFPHPTLTFKGLGCLQPMVSASHGTRRCFSQRIHSTGGRGRFSYSRLPLAAPPCSHQAH